MDDAAPRIPLVLAAELDAISCFQRSNPIGQLDVMRDQQRLAGRQPNDESLVRAAIAIISQHFGDLAATVDLNIASVILERCRYLVDTADAADASIMPSWDVATFYGAEVRKRQENTCYQELLHRR
jgi:hypothetical protein